MPTVTTNATTATPTTTRMSAPTITPTGTPTGIASATATGTPAPTATPTNLRRQPREIPFRPTISVAGGAEGVSPLPPVLLTAVLTGAWTLAWP